MYIALIIALLLSGGASLAVENSSPGDALYPVKTHLNEEVKNVLTFGSSVQAKSGEQNIDASAKSDVAASTEVEKTTTAIRRRSEPERK